MKNNLTRYITNFTRHALNLSTSKKRVPSSGMTIGAYLRQKFRGLKMNEIAQVQLNELSNLDTSYTKTLFKLEEANRMNSELSIQLHAAQQSLQEAKIQLAVSLQAHESMSKQLALLQEKDANDEREKLYLLASILQNQESRSTTTDKIDDSTTPPPQAPQQTIQAR